MAKPNFQILTDSVVYTNALTPITVKALSSDEFSSSYFLWDFGDNTRIRGEEVSHVYSTVGEYDITLTQYLSSGEVATSDSQTITSVNLIPNLMQWDDNSYNAGSITASVKNEIPYSINIYNSWQQYDKNSFLNLYVENSKSIPFDITDKKIHLKPNWRFLDENDIVIDTIKINQSKIYAQTIDDKIYLSTIETIDSVFVGISSNAEFYFIDDTPSGIDPTEAYLPSTIIVSQNLSSVYGDDKFSNEDYLQYPNIIKSVFVDNIVPDKLSVTSNGVFDIDYIKYQNTKIPYNIRLVDDSGNFIKTNPIENPAVSAYDMSIGLIGDVIADSNPSFKNNTLERFKPDFRNLGGFYESYFIPITTSPDTVILSASTQIDYTLNEQLTRFGIFSDENSNKIYRVSFVEGFNKEYIRKDAEVNINTFDTNYSNKFGAAIDLNYNSLFLDSDDSRLEIYNTSFNLLTSYNLSSYDELILNHSSPAQICLDINGNQLITLTDSSKILYKENDTITDYTLYTSNLLSSGGITYEPTALEILSDNDTLYISYTNNLSSFVEKYNINRNTFSLSSVLKFENIPNEITMDIISNRIGNEIAFLQNDYYTQASNIKIYDTSTDNIINTINVGYNVEYITLDVDQNLWVASQSISNSSYDILYKVDNSGILSSFPLSTFSGNSNNIGGIAGDSYGNIWVIDSDRDSVIILNKDNPSNYQEINILEDNSITDNKYVAYGDWNGFRWYNKFGFGGQTITYNLSGQSEPFVVHPENKYNLQKINEDFDMTETLKSYRTTDNMLNYENLFDNFLGSIYGNKYDDGSYFGKNLYEKIANFVMNHADIETCSIDALESFCQETGIEFTGKVNFPRDIKRLVDLFSIKFKKLWGDNYQTGIIEDFKGNQLDTSSYIISADPQTKIIATEKFNDFNTIVIPLIVDNNITYPLSSYDQKWGWGLSVPSGGDIKNYYDFYELLPITDQKLNSIIDWDNELSDTSLIELSSFDNYMTKNGTVSTILGDKIRKGLGLFI